MLVASPLRSSNTDGNIKGGSMEANFDDFPDFTSGNLLDSIDFDDLFMGLHQGDVLPDLEMDPDLLAEFSLSNTTTNTGGDNDSSSAMSVGNNTCDDAFLDAHHQLNTTTNHDVILDKDDYIKKDECQTDVKLDSSSKEGEKGKKSSSYSKNNNSNNNNNQAKRKTKVDWTPELHRRFVQAVEQLGVDKAVPSRILELMGIDCLTRHNIASHLQKYRSHRKHLLAREAEAANWTQKRQMYGVAMGGGKGGGNISPWYPPTMGFPPVTANMHHHHHPFRPLHVWGHPTMDPQARLPMWPKQVTPLPPAWAAPPPPPPDPSFWHSPHHRRVGVAAVPGIPPHIMFRPDQHVLPLQSGSHPPFDLHPSKESIDAAIGDVLAKPWQPLPIGLKPPSMDSVMVELQRQGIPKIPPSCA